MALLALLLAAPRDAAGGPPPCVVDPGSATFTYQAGGTLVPGPSAQCLYHGHALACGPLSATSQPPGTPSWLVTMTGPTGPSVRPRAIQLASTPPGLLFQGPGGPATLTLEYRPDDIPTSQPEESLRAYVLCPGPQVDPVAPCAPRTALPPLPAEVWCMPEADPGIDRATRTVRTEVDRLPPAAAVLPALVRVESPATWTFTRTSPVDLTGVVQYYDLTLLGPARDPAAVCMSLERVGPSGQVATSTVAHDPATGSWSATAVALEQDDNRLTVRVTDPSWNRSFDRVVVVLDTVPPSVELEGVAGGAVIARVPVAIVAREVERWPGTHAVEGRRLLAPFLGDAGADEAIAFHDADLRLVAETPPAERRLALPELLLDGDYSLRWTSTDRAGNPGGAEVAFTIDSTPPVVAVDGVAEGAFLRATVPVEIAASDRNLVTLQVEVTVDGAPEPAACDDLDPDPRLTRCTLRAAREGVWAVSVLATDLAGNTKRATVSFAVDRTAPEVIITGADEGQFARAPFPLAVSIRDASRDPAGWDPLESTCRHASLSIL